MPPCQSEFAEAPAIKQYTLRAMPSSATMEGNISLERGNHFVRNGKARPRSVFAASEENCEFNSGFSHDPDEFQAKLKSWIEEFEQED